VGNAYLRQASKLMREEILPAATVLYAHAASRLDDAYASGTSATEVVLLVVVGAVALLLLLVVEVYLYRRTHRMVNVGLAAATVVVAVLCAWTLARRLGAQLFEAALVVVRREGDDAGAPTVLGRAYTETDIRFGLEDSYRTLARFAPTKKVRVAWVDRANAARPRTFL
jgi:hypothetical protein